MKYKFSNDGYKYFIAIIFILKILLCVVFYYNGDLLYRATWVSMLRGHSLSDAYYQFDSMKEIYLSIDYPPIYIYYLWLLSFIPGLFDYTSLLSNGLSLIEMLLMKFPAFIFDITCFSFLYKNIDKDIALKWLILPLNIIACCLFGDSEIVLGFFVITTLYYIYKNSYNLAAISLAISLSIKPQSVYLCMCCLVILILAKISLKDKIKTVLISLTTFYVIWLPFIINKQDILFPLKYFLTVSNRWESITRGAGNITAIYSIIRNMFGSLNITSFDTVTNYIIILSIIILGIYMLYKTNNILLCTGVMWISLYSLTLNQQCRYIYYPVIILLYVSYKQDKELFNIINIIHYITCIDVFISRLVEDIKYITGIYVFVHIICTVCYCVMYIILMCYIFKSLKNRTLCKMKNSD